MSNQRRLSCALLAASGLVVPHVALAQASDREAVLEARLAKLESEMAALRADLAAAREETPGAAPPSLPASSAPAVASAVSLAPPPTPPASPPPATDGFTAGNGATRIRLGGFIKMVASTSRFSDGEVATNSLGRDFYLPQTIPTGGGSAQRVEDFTAKQTRLWLNFDTLVAGHSLNSYIEVDFQTSPGSQGSQRTTNGYNLALRRAWIKLGRVTMGQDWSTFQYTGALPESTDFVGTTEGTVFVRQPLIRYSAPLSRALTLHAALEEPESGTANAGSATLTENGDDRLPDFAARLALAGKAGEASLAVLARQVRVDDAGLGDTAFGWGVSAGGKLFLNPARSADLRAMVTYGHNASRYIGLNFAPDAVYVAATNRLEDVDVLAGLLAVKVPLGGTLRTNVMASYQRVFYADALSEAMIGTYNRQAWSVAANLFYSPVPSVDLGVEIRHGTRQLVNGDDGALDRLEFAARYSF
ncbi:porin [Novosphingobium sp. 1949]|uniref:Porin n=1 Tax=Novosphingobium organovorum TaxID=2930092 RepID=A0ABT0B8N7_9SPHN|nr:DcaP family trimeric outer membrane transporter [Novosphingobium organovorum]MCJ2181393.1 porin [Novosphingobium organovorum]